MSKVGYKNNNNIFCGNECTASIHSKKSLTEQLKEAQWFQWNEIGQDQGPDKLYPISCGSFTKDLDSRRKISNLCRDAR